MLWEEVIMLMTWIFTDVPQNFFLTMNAAFNNGSNSISGEVRISSAFIAATACDGGGAVE